LNAQVVWQLPAHPASTVTSKTTYAEPTVMWRLRRADDGRRGYSVIIPFGPKATAIWYINGIVIECCDFATWHGALYWLEKTRLTLRVSGWDREELCDDQPASQWL
jgi:hypothetical protein